jgi:hypothetical protein
MAQSEVGAKPTRRSSRELIILANERGGPLLLGSAPPGRGDKGLARLEALLIDAGGRFQPILRKSSAAIDAQPPRSRRVSSGAPAARQRIAARPASDVGRFFRVLAPDSSLEALRDQLAGSPLISGAYIKPPSDVPIINDMPPGGPPPQAASPDLTGSQIYLGSPPGGIGVNAAWGLKGGTGDGVGVTDLEWAWESMHEDLGGKRGLLAGTPRGDTNHGTAVIGVLGANRNAFGVTGIAYSASLGWHAFSTVSSQAIEDAAAASRPGDILLLEIHRPGPRHAFALRDDQAGYIAIEWWPDDFQAIRYAVGRGVLVVEAAGNGAENFDDRLYETPDVGFGSEWRNPFRREAADSGAILVGAGSPPPGTHGRDWGPDRSRLDFSNYGASVDAQGWGREVTSCGYGDRQGGQDARRWYTEQFSGTSSASPIVAGALACVQGYLLGAGRRVLTPADARVMLRETGSVQQNAIDRPASQRIGSRPDLSAMIAWAETRTRPPS